MNSHLIHKRFAKSLNTYEQQADIQMHIAKTLAQKAAVYLPAVCDCLLEIGCGTGFLTREVLSHISASKLYLNDLVAELSERINQVTGNFGKQTEVVFIPGDAQKITFPDSMQGVLSASTLQWISNQADFFRKINDALQPGGIFLFNTFGSNNFHEIKTLMDAGLHYPDKTELQEMLSPSFEMLEMWEETHIRCFDSPRDILRHLQETGVTATADNFRWSKKKLQTFENSYYKQFSQNGKVTLTWQVYYFVCKKKTI